jgi:hypothetical protein
MKMPLKLDKVLVVWIWTALGVFLPAWASAQGAIQGVVKLQGASDHSGATVTLRVPGEWPVPASSSLALFVLLGALLLLAFRYRRSAKVMLAMLLGVATLVWAAMETVSDSDGDYSFVADFAPGSYGLEFVHAGYESAARVVQVQSGATVDVGLVTLVPSGDVPSRFHRLTDELLAAGFTIAQGEVAEYDLSNCCVGGNFCYGNNPTSPYLTVRVHDAPGQPAPNTTPDRFRLRPEEALVLLGDTPPPLAYFGFTPYLFDRDDGAGTRIPVFASLSETLNHEVIGVEGPGQVYSRPTVVLVTADAGVDASVRAALVAAGYPEASINTLVLDPTVARFGLDEAADQFTVILRLALPDDEAALAAYSAAPPFSVLRVTPVGAVSQPLGKPPSRAKNLSDSENSLLSSLALFAVELKSRFEATYTITEIQVSETDPDPEACISGLRECNGDNRDTTYPRSDPFRFPDAGSFIVVLGVDHKRTNKVTYASATILAETHLAGIESATSYDWAGSAAAIAPSIPNVDKLYVRAFARAEVGNGLSTTVVSTTEPCLPEGANVRVVFRTYLEPGYATAPDLSTLVRDRVFLLEPR